MPVLYLEERNSHHFEMQLVKLGCNIYREYCDLLNYARIAFKTVVYTLEAKHPICMEAKTTLNIDIKGSRTESLLPSLLY